MCPVVCPSASGAAAVLGRVAPEVSPSSRPTAARRCDGLRCAYFIVVLMSVHRSTRELETAIERYIEVTNERPRPFVWTKTADEILASVARFCHRISNSGH